MTENERIELFKEEMESCFPQILPFGVVEKLQSMNFFTAPASIHHHGQYEGGLFDHSYKVMKALLDLTDKLGLIWERPESPYIVGMFHDLCKTGNYIHREEHGEEAWEYNNATLLPGHGEKSVILLQQIISTPLTEEELLCIRWHMGAFDNKENWNSYGRSVTEYPNVLFTHTADMIAARIMRI